MLSDVLSAPPAARVYGHNLKVLPALLLHVFMTERLFSSETQLIDLSALADRSYLWTQT